ncbi:HAD-IA family hydrolase [Tardiphaga sp.]|uniref:HAD-IA family hydrolase n=1 Tax=Tardiphaga sp. TaxID=1926292 RepID=UPI0026277D1A|nr:HAD-IA family hydrolase [Tardiphaga sp.]MDB5621364.1 family phosphatase [Tardiphaga sp.]
MPLYIPNRVVVFDYGEVISLSPTPADRSALLSVADVAAEPFWAAYDRHRDDLDRGTLDVPAYWQRVADDVGAAWSASDVHRLWAADFRGWISVEPGTLDLIVELRDGGTRLAILSNAGFDFGSPLRFSPMGRYFERVFVSAEMDALKPEPAIYLEAAAQLGIAMEDMVFIDNKVVNTDAAAALGATAHHFTGVAELREFLSGLAR